MVFPVQTLPHRRNIAFGQWNGHHLRESASRQRLKAKMTAQLRLRPTRQGMTVGAHLRPVMLTLKINRRRHSQISGDVAGAMPFIALNKIGIAAPAMRNHKRLNHLMVFAAHMQKSRPFRRAQPLMKIAAVHIGRHLLQIQRYLPRCMGAINDGQDAQLTRPSTNLFHWKNKRRRRCNMAHRDHFCIVSDISKKIIDKVIIRAIGQARRMTNDAGAAFDSDKFQQSIDRAIFVIRRQNFVAALQTQ